MKKVNANVLIYFKRSNSSTNYNYTFLFQDTKANFIEEIKKYFKDNGNHECEVEILSNKYSNYRKGTDILI